MRLLIFVVLLSTNIHADVFAQPESQEAERLASHIIKKCILLNPKEVLYICGTTQLLPLMQTLSVAAQTVGSKPRLLVVNAQPFLNQIKSQKKIVADSLPHADAIVVLGSFYTNGDSLVNENYNALELTQNAFHELASKGVRILYVSIPSESEAKILNVDYSEYATMLGKANVLEQDDIRNILNRAYGLFASSTTVRVTTPSGTDLRFQFDKNSIVIKDGILTPAEQANTLSYYREEKLPGGFIEAEVASNSAYGRLVIPHSVCNNQPMTGVYFQFANGRIDNFTAKTGGDCFETLLKKSSNRMFLKKISFGGNYELKRMQENGGLWWPKEGAGIIWVTFESLPMRDNKNTAPLQFSFPIIQPTVEVDGKVVLKSSN